ncbi:MAG: RAMP superfamily CRISPR-associated protein [Rhizobium sp.]
MSTTTPLWLHISTLSDWAIGTGKGRYASLDSMVARDAQDLPYIPASTLKGMLRDASEQAALALDDGRAGNWTAFVDRLFGSQPVVEAKVARTDYEAPTGGILRFGAAQLGVGPDGEASILRQHLSRPGRASGQLRQALTFVKPGVAIDRMSGTAKTDMLRFEEVARQKLTLLAHLDLELSGRDAETATAFLQAACFLMDRIGAKRRRGLGHIEAVLLPRSVSATNLDVSNLRKDAAKLLSAVSGPPSPSASPKGTASVPPDVVAAGPDASLVATYSLLTPVLAASSVEGNVVVSLDHLPGSMLLPAIKRALTARTGKTLDEAILTGCFSVSTALPMQHGECGLVAPTCFERLKSTPPTGVQDKLFNILDAEGTQTSPQKKGLGGGYLRIAGNVARSSKVSRSLFTHNSIDDEAQRPDASIGGVYVYEALSAGNEFQGHVRLPSDIAKNAAGSYEISVGRAKTAGYGRIRVTLAPAETTRHTVQGNTIRIYLASDAVCHGRFGQPETSADALALAIGEAAGMKSGQVRIESAVLKAKTIQSWSVAGGLPRPTIIAIAAGSVACVEFRSEADAQAFADVAVKGIGERRAEGFGQIRINPSWLLKGGAPAMADGNDGGVQKASALPVLKPSDTDYRMAGFIEDAAWRAYVVDAVEALVADEESFKKVFGFVCGSDEKQSNGTPSASQLGSLKAAIVAAGDAGSADAIRGFLTRPAGSSTAAPSAEMEKKLGRPFTRALWGIATKTNETVFPALLHAMPAPPACITAIDSKTVFSRVSGFAVSALVLAGIQMHGRRRARTGQSEEVF